MTVAVVYRGGDAVSGWAFAGLTATGYTLSTIPFVAVPLAVGWSILAWGLGKRKESPGSREDSVSAAL